MNPGVGAAALGLLFAWATFPWPLVRWTAAATLIFLGLSALWSFLVRRGLAVRGPTSLWRTFSGRRLEVETIVENRSPLPTGRLFLNDSSGGLETWGDTRRWVSLPPWRRIRFGFAVRGRERGERSLGPLQISGTDPAGLFPFLLAAPSRSLLVYPPVRRLAPGSPRGLPGGPRRWDQAPTDDPSRFRSYRDFAPGDSLARLSAAAWARTGRPQVRTYDFTSARPTLVALDLRAEAYPLKARWALMEAAVERAAARVWSLVGQGQTVWLAVADGSSEPPLVGPATSYDAVRPLLERLARAVPDRRPDPPVPAWPRPTGIRHVEFVGPSRVDPGPTGEGAAVVRHP